MATYSIGRVVKLNDEMTDAMIEAFKKPRKKVEVPEEFIEAKANPKPIEKLKGKSV